MNDAFHHLVSLTDPSLDPLFWTAERLGVASSWWGHVPLAHWIVCVTRPNVLVELGTSNGVSYSAFCQAVDRLSLATRCYAVSAGPDALAPRDEAFAELQQFHDERYSTFSKIIQSNLHAAPRHFVDHSIDLLHMDYLACNDAMRDFRNWKSKLSERAIVLFHNTNTCDSNDGVWRLWAELKDRPHIEFPHGNGLGLLAVGDQTEPAIRALCAVGDPSATMIRRRFAAVGARWVSQAREAAAAEEYNRNISDAIAERDQARVEAHGWEVRAKDHARAREQIALRIDAARHDVYDANLRAEQAEAALMLSDQNVHDANLRAEQAEAARKHAWIEAERLMRERDAVLSSTTWRATSPLRNLVRLIHPGLAWASRLGGTSHR